MKCRTDVHSRFPFALATPRRYSQIATLARKMTLFPLPITRVLPDNGCEVAKHFATVLEDQGSSTGPPISRTREMNAHVERFNRTAQEEFVGFDLLQDHVVDFNERLLDYFSGTTANDPIAACGQDHPGRPSLFMSPTVRAICSGLLHRLTRPARTL